MTPLTEEDIVPPELPENTAGIINLLIDAMKLGGYEALGRAYRNLSVNGARRFTQSDLHEIDQLCHRLGVASGTPSWYWLELIMDRPVLRCAMEPGCTNPQYEGGPACAEHTF